MTPIANITPIGVYAISNQKHNTLTKNEVACNLKDVNKIKLNLTRSIHSAEW